MGIFPTEKGIVLYNLQTLSILMVHKASDNNQSITRKTNKTFGRILVIETEEQGHVVRVGRTTTPRPMSETHVSFNTNARGIAQVDLYTLFRQLYLCIAAHGIMDILPGRTFRMLIAKASISFFSLGKHQRVAIAWPPPLEILHNKNDELLLYSVS